MQICKELEGGECKAKVLLDKLCRNNTVVRTMVTSDYKTNIPLKDRCGVYCTVLYCTVLYCTVLCRCGGTARPPSSGTGG